MRPAPPAAGASHRRRAVRPAAGLLGGGQAGRPRGRRGPGRPGRHRRRPLPPARGGRLMRGRTALAAALCVAVLLLGAPPAAAGQYVDKAVSALRGDHVYLDPDARAVPAAAARRPRDRILGAGTPVFIAILPERARGEGSGGEPATSVAAMIADGVGEAGAYGVLVGNQFRAGDLGETLPRNP